MDATADTVIQAGDVVAVAGRRDVLVSLIGAAAEEVDDRELLAVPVEGVDVYVTSKEVDGQDARRAGQTVLRRAASSCARSPAERPRPTSRSCRTRRCNRGDILTLVGRTQDMSAATKALGYPDRADRRRRRGLHRRGDRHRRPARRARLQGRRRAAHAVHLRRRA